MIDLERLNKERSSALNSLIKKLGLDAMLLTGYDNVRYATGKRPVLVVDWYDPNSALLAPDSEPILMAQWAQGSPGGQPPREAMGRKNFPITLNAIIANIWARIYAKNIANLRPKKRIGVDHLPFEIFLELKKLLPDYDFVPILKDLLLLRSIKSDLEIQLLREAAKVVDAGLETAFKMMKPGMNERQIYGAAVASMIVEGSEGEPFFQMASSGESSVMNIFPTDRRIRDGETVIIDLGSMVEGYVGDAMRTGYAGATPSYETKLLYSSLYDAYFEGMKLIKPQTRTLEIDKAIRNCLLSRGYPDLPLAMGHGVGLRCIELPSISSEENDGDGQIDVLKAGMTLALEPRTFKKGIGMVGIEDVVLVTSAGYELLNKASYCEGLLLK